MISVLIRRCILLVLFLLVVTPVYAGGIGLFLNAGSVDARWDGDAPTQEFKGEHLDFGFAVDSNLDTDRMFNYRMEFGRAAWKIDHFDNQNAEADIDGLVMSHTFGFGGLLTDNVRLWFGPELRFTLLDGQLENEVARDIDLFGYGVGAVIGLNFNLPGRLTIAAKGGYVMMNYYGNGPNWNGSSWQSSSYDVDEDLVYLGVSMFFRSLN